MMGREIELQQPQEEEERRYPVKQQAAMATSAFAAMGLVDVFAHLGPTGLFIGGIASYLAWKHGPGAYERVYAALPQEAIDAVSRFLPLPSPVMVTEVKEEPMQEESEPLADEDEQMYPEPIREGVPVFPIGPEQETLRLGAVLKTGQRFDPSFKKLFGRGWVAAANQGFGKSILNGVIIEQAGKCGLRVIVLDHKGEYGTVEELPFMNALRAGAGSDFDFPLTPDNADRLVESVMVNRYQAIVDLPSYGDGWLDRAQIVAAVGQSLMRYATRQRAAGKKLKQCLVILDEAQLYLPQNAQLLPAEARKNEGVLSDLNNAYFSLVSNGRSAGYTLGFATQSLTYLAKWAIKSTGVKIFGRHAERNDLNAIQEDIDPQVASRADIESFPPGVGVVFGFTDKPMVVQFDNKRSRDVSFTPGFDDPDDEEEQDEVELFLSEAEDVDPDDDRYEDEFEDEEIEPLTPDLQVVYDVYRQYMSDRKIAQVLGTTHATVGKKRERLIALGYIDRKTGAKLV